MRKGNILFLILFIFSGILVAQTLRTQKADIIEANVSGGTVDIQSPMTINTTAEVNAILDEDDMVSDSTSALVTQQSVKAYTDTQTAGGIPTGGSAKDILVWNGSAWVAQATAQLTNLSVGGTIDASLVMDIISTTKGSRPCPAMTEVQRDAISSPTDGSCVFNSTANALNVYYASAWNAVGGGAGGGITTYVDVATAEAEGCTDNDLEYVVSTETFYRCEDDGAAYTRDGTFVLNTLSGGNTRRLSISGKYIVSDILYRDLVSTATNPTHKEGRLFYDPIKKAVSYYNDESDVTVNLGQELVIQIKNPSLTATIPNCTVIYPIGNDGGVTTVGYADNTSESTSKIIGVTTHDILPNQTGWATKFGAVSDCNTSTFTANSEAYVGTNGAITPTKPTGGSFVTTVGIVDTVDAVNGILFVDIVPTQLTVEVTNTNGFPEDQRTGTTLSVIDGTRTFTIAPTGSEFHYYIAGQKYERTSSDSVVFTNTEGPHIIYYDGTTLTALAGPTDAQVEDIIKNKCIVSYIYWDATNSETIVINDERHGISMSPDTHYNLHNTRGSQYLNGLAISGILSEQDGSSDTHAQFGVGSGETLDEDIKTEYSAIASTAGLSIYYLEGANNYLRKATETGFSVLLDTTAGVGATGRPVFNEYTGGAWQLTTVPDNSYFLVHVFGINGYTGEDQQIAIMGQDTYGNVTIARAGAQTEISNLISVLPAPERVPIATIIFQSRSTYTNSVLSRIRTTDTGEDYVNWLTTELASGNTPNSHNNLTDLQLAASSVTWGHIDDQDQSIEGNKTINAGRFYFEDDGFIGADNLLLIDSEISGSLGLFDGARNTIIGQAASTIVDWEGVNDSVVIGHGIGRSMVDTSGAVIIGSRAGDNLTGNRGIFIGQNAGLQITTGTDQGCIGASCLYQTTTGTNNFCIGSFCLYTGNNSNRLAFGPFAGRYAADDGALVVDNRDRGDNATEQTHAIMYGHTATNPKDQDLTINAEVKPGILDGLEREIFYEDAGEIDKSADFENVLSTSTFAYDTTTHLFGKGGYKLTIATGETGFLCTEPIAVPLGARGGFIGYKMRYAYDGDDSDLSVDLYDITNSATISSVSLSASGKERTIAGGIQSTTASVKACFFADTVNNGKILTFDNTLATAKPVADQDLYEMASVVYDTEAGYGSTNTKIPYFTNARQSDTNGLITIGNDSTNGFSVTVNRNDVQLTMTYSYYADAGNRSMGISLNSTQLTTGIFGINTSDRLAYANVSANNGQTVAITKIFNSGDILRPHTEGNVSAQVGRNHITITAIAKKDAVSQTTDLPANEWHAKITGSLGASFQVEDETGFTCDVIVTRPVAQGQYTFDYTACNFTSTPRCDAELITNLQRTVSVDKDFTYDNTECTIEILDSASPFGRQDEDFNMKITKSSPDWKDLTANISVPITQTCYINTDATYYMDTLSTSATYQIRPLTSLEGDCGWVDLDANQITFTGKVILSVPVARGSGGTDMDCKITNATDAVTEKEFLRCAYDTYGGSVVNYTFNLTTSKAFEFYTKTNGGSGEEHFGRIKLTRIFGGN